MVRIGEYTASLNKLDMSVGQPVIWKGTVLSSSTCHHLFRAWIKIIHWSLGVGPWGS